MKAIYYKFKKYMYMKCHNMLLFAITLEINFTC